MGLLRFSCRSRRAEKTNVKIKANILLIHQRRNKDLSHMIHLHDELVSLAGHELRNPLAALSLQIRILKDALNQGSAENQGHIVKIANQSEQNVKRIENLLDRMIILLNNSPIDKLQ